MFEPEGTAPGLGSDSDRGRAVGERQVPSLGGRVERPALQRGAVIRVAIVLVRVPGDRQTERRRLP